MATVEISTKNGGRDRDRTCDPFGVNEGDLSQTIDKSLRNVADVSAPFRIGSDVSAAKLPPDDISHPATARARHPYDVR